MQELGAVHMTFFMDRGLKKVRVNLVRGSNIVGYLKPIGGVERF
jgi:hypothetical protein